MRLQALRLLATVCVCMGVTLQADSADRAGALRKFMSGAYTDYDMSFTCSSTTSAGARTALLEALTRSAAQRGATIVSPATTGSDARQYEVRVSTRSLWVRRHRAGMVSGAVLGPHHSMLGWVSNIFWTVENRFMRVDHDRGRTYSNSLEVLRDFRSADVGLFGVDVMLAMRFGVPSFVGGVVWEENRFTAQESAGNRIVGELILADGVPDGLVYDYAPREGSQPVRVHTTVSISYSREEDTFPSGLVLRREHSPAGGPTETYVTEFRDIRVRLDPQRDESAFSPECVIQEYRDAIHVTVVSNGWAHTAFRGGEWVKVPEPYRPTGYRRTAGMSVWMARGAVAILVFGPVALAVGRAARRGRTPT